LAPTLFHGRLSDNLASRNRWMAFVPNLERYEVALSSLGRQKFLIWNPKWCVRILPEKLENGIA
jgi:hypothetical protein